MNTEIVKFFTHLLYEEWSQKQYFQGMWIDLTEAFPNELPLKAYALAQKERIQLAEQQNRWHRERFHRTNTANHASLSRSTQRRCREDDEEYSKQERWALSQGIIEPAHKSRKAYYSTRVPLEDYIAQYHEEEF